MAAVPNGSLYKYFSKSGFLRFLRGFTVRFTPPCAFNDPFEAVPTITELLSGESFIWDQLQAALAISFGGKVGMFCLSEDPLNLLMWGHYCNAHQGVVVEFDVTNPFFSARSTASGLHQYLRKVEYREHRATLPLEHFQKNKMGLLNDHGSGWLDLVRSEHPLMFTKSPDWSYEREWRLVRQLVDSRDSFRKKPKAARMFTGHHVDDDYARDPAPASVELAQVPEDCVKALYLGAKSTTYTGNMPTFEEEVWSLLSKRRIANKILINKVRFDRERFGLLAFDLQDSEQVRANVSELEFASRSNNFEGIPFRNGPPRPPQPTRR
ncbi:MAG: DUF2971 domain-containing protein [Aromatoleum sp.]|jgi:hypothetical protein|uniref:DUF2971 domain-containing protein n=1 Tax=Aromatoleum sp. TaxID=2307007 RepID=UPI0028949DE7|nr:DUF2971 domain-containing protein [Aromatoleum sp.]MDT3668963.1 DUF2971 domain-containing protein [Aromatoleum sp.]